ncbi:unnamed protein product [Fusarium fujikuroi]|nr:unnamed protein product [Fusarium fujikuroi]VZH91557.1 unnamed protein product [Fusarium fujikuroi]
MDIDVGDNISELGFLPGIIIDGHEWRFHARIHILGSTTTIVGVFRILAGIRAINMWIRDTFWPWYKKYELSPKID